MIMVIIEEELNKQIWIHCKKSFSTHLFKEMIDILGIIISKARVYRLYAMPSDIGI